MRLHITVRLGFVFGMGLLFAANTYLLVAPAIAANPYQSIIDRNVFGLKPAPTPEELAAANLPPPPKVALIGIANMLGKNRAVLKMIDPPKPGQPPLTEPFVLSEGEAQNEIEVKQINENEGTVRIINHGQEMTLSLKDDAGKAGAVPGAGAPVMQMAAVGPTAGGVARPVPNRPTPTPTAPPPPTVPRPSQPGNPAASLNPNISGQVAAGPPVSLGSGQSIPQRPVRTPDTLGLEEQIIMIEAQRELARQQNDPIFRILPPTPMTSPEDLQVITAPVPPPEP